MNAYACTECDWQYEVWTMGDRVKAVKRHQLAHLLERYGWLNNIEVFADRLIRYGLDVEKEAGQNIRSTTSQVYGSRQ